MPHLLPRTKSALAGGLFHRRFRNAELLPARGKKLRNILDRVVSLGWSSRLLPAGGNTVPPPASTLVLVFIRVMCGRGRLARAVAQRPPLHPTAPSTQFLD